MCPVIGLHHNFAHKTKHKKQNTDNNKEDCEQRRKDIV